VTNRPPGSLSHARRRDLQGLLFVLPVVLGTVIFNVAPAIASLVLSLTEWDLLTPPRFVGFANFVELLSADPFALGAIRNTVLFVVGSVALGMVGSLVLALLVNQPLRGIAVFRLAYYLPVVTSVVATGLVWQWLLNSRLGLVNGVLAEVGVDGPGWLVEPGWAIVSLIIISVWQGLGTNMMIYLAGLQNVPGDLLDAARIDGAGAWRRFRDVTLPMLSPTTFFILITSLIGSFQVFALVFVLTIAEGAGGRSRVMDVWIYYLWQNAFSYFRMGYASAMAWLLFLVIGALTILQWRLASRWVFYE
jgi:multiple sugar transport system permease protein